MGIEEAISTRPTVSNTSSGMGRTRGRRCNGVAQLEQSGINPLGGCNTKAGLQQPDGQRKRGIDR